MYLRNYYNLLNAYYGEDTPDSATSEPVDYTPPLRIKLPNGSYMNPIAGRYNTYNLQNGIGGVKTFGLPVVGKSEPSVVYNNTLWKNANAYFGIGFGSGSTPVDYDDCALETPAGDIFTFGATNLIQKSQLVNGKLNSVRRFSFTVASDFVVREVGLYVQYSTTSSYNAGGILVYREVIDPITLYSGDQLALDLTRNVKPFGEQPY